MRAERINYFMVGIFVLAIVSMAFVTLLAVTGGNGATENYYTQYQHVGGIRVGTPVTYGGYQIGQVKDIAPQLEDMHPSYRLQLAVRKGWHIAKGSVANIVAPGFLSEKQIDISAGTQLGFYTPGDSLESVESHSLFAAFDELGSEFKRLTEQDIRPLLKDASSSLLRVTQQVENTGGLVNQALPEMFARLESLLNELNNSAQNLNAVLGQTQRRKLGNILDNSEAVSVELRDVAQGFSHTLDGLNAVLVKSDRLLSNNEQDIQGSVQDLRKTMAVLANSIDAIVMQIDSGSRNMEEFTRQIRNTPSLLLRGKNSGADSE